MPDQKYTIEILEDVDIDGYAKVYETNLPKDYIIDDWCVLSGGKIGSLDADLYREKDITEIDVEIKKLVDVLNKIPGVITTTSCCGHGKIPGYVAFVVNNIEFLSYLSGIMYNIYPNKWVLTTNYHTYNSLNSSINFHICLQTEAIGEEAYSDINNLADYLSKNLLNLFK